jgi:hypothetical protein
MDYDAYLSQQCPMEIQQIVRGADLRRSSAAQVFDQVADIGTADFRCLLTAIGYVGQGLNPRSDARAVDAWLVQVATYAGYFSAEELEDTRKTMLKIAIPDGNGMMFFEALRRNNIDIRAELAGKVPPVWTFARPRDLGALAWHYNLYLARFRDADALGALANKIANTRSGNDVTLLLRNLAEVGTVEARDVITAYANDERTADGVDGPGPRISETVQLLLANTIWQ